MSNLGRNSLRSLESYSPRGGTGKYYISTVRLRCRTIWVYTQALLLRSIPRRTKNGGALRYISDWHSVPAQPCQSIRLISTGIVNPCHEIITLLKDLPDSITDPYVLRVVSTLQLVAFRYTVQWVDGAGFTTGYRADWWSHLRLTDNSTVGLIGFRPFGLADLTCIND